MKIMYINDLGWWLIALLNFLGYFIYSFGSISNGAAREMIKFIGAILFVLSFILMFAFFGLGSGIGLIVLAFIIVAPITGLLMATIEKRLYGHYMKKEETLAEKYQMPISELRKYKDKSASDIIEEVMPGIMERDEQYRKRHQEMLERMQKEKNET